MANSGNCRWESDKMLASAWRFYSMVVIRFGLVWWICCDDQRRHEPSNIRKSVSFVMIANALCCFAYHKFQIDGQIIKIEFAFYLWINFTYWAISKSHSCLIEYTNRPYDCAIAAIARNVELNALRCWSVCMRIICGNVMPRSIESYSSV